MLNNSFFFGVCFLLLYCEIKCIDNKIADGVVSRWALNIFINTIASLMTKYIENVVVLCLFGDITKSAILEFQKQGFTTSWKASKTDLINKNVQKGFLIRFVIDIRKHVLEQTQDQVLQPKIWG